MGGWVGGEEGMTMLPSCSRDHQVAMGMGRARWEEEVVG